jgi:hypothetical protein
MVPWKIEIRSPVPYEYGGRPSIMSAALEDLYNLLTWFPDHSIN